MNTNLHELNSMTRIDAEWLVAFALHKAGVLNRRRLIEETHLNLGRNAIMRRCRCGREYFDVCPDCTYRNGGAIPERELFERDTVTRFELAHSGRIAEMFELMRIQLP